MGSGYVYLCGGEARGGFAKVNWEKGFEWRRRRIRIGVSKRGVLEGWMAGVTAGLKKRE